MTPFGKISSKTTLNHLFVITILIVLPLISSSSLNKTRNSSGFTIPLIPPISPDSPYYTQVLEANNIFLTNTKSNNVSLNQSHYIKWLKTLFPSPMSKTDIGDKKYSTVTYDKFGAGYTTKLYIGKPPQLVSGLFDTGSEVIWFQCQGNPNNYDQLKSSTFKSIECSDKDKCDSSTSAEIRCGPRNNCEFKADYADKTHAVGVMGTDIAFTTLEGDDSLAAPELMFACTDNNGANKFIKGIIGAGISKYSFPMQISPNDQRFSYCLSSSMDGNYKIKFGEEASLLGPSTTLGRNKFLPFYYLQVIGIKVQDQAINVSPYEYKMAPDGSRGFVIDSGSTLSYLTAKVFDAVEAELVKLLGVAQKHWIFDVCYPITRFYYKMGIIYKPEITIQFQEFSLVLSIDGTWMEQDGPEQLHCLAIKRTTDSYSILGVHQLWDVNVGHDPVNSKLYLTRNDCDN